jgi:hypothetical protein
MSGAEGSVFIWLAKKDRLFPKRPSANSRTDQFLFTGDTVLCCYVVDSTDSAAKDESAPQQQQ